MKTLFLGANWKMNPPPKDWDAETSPYKKEKNVTVVVFPTHLDLVECVGKKIAVGAQCGRAESNGAFTGDVSMEQLKTIGCTHVLCGHSERRQHHGETSEQVCLQVSSAANAGLIPILCIGETADQREMDETEEVLTEQLLPLKTAEGMLIAYEPMWAIGTGKTPTPAEAEKTHAFIRSILRDKKIPILYGGSLTAANAEEFFAQKNIDGGLIGGSSLKPNEFKGIVEAAKKA